MALQAKGFGAGIALNGPNRIVAGLRRGGDIAAAGSNKALVAGIEQVFAESCRSHIEAFGAGFRAVHAQGAVAESGVLLGRIGLQRVAAVGHGKAGFGNTALAGVVIVVTR